MVVVVILDIVNDLETYYVPQRKMGFGILADPNPRPNREDRPKTLTSSPQGRQNPPTAPAVRAEDTSRTSPRTQYRTPKTSVGADGARTLYSVIGTVRTKYSMWMGVVYGGTVRTVEEW